MNTRDLADIALAFQNDIPQLCTFLVAELHHISLRHNPHSSGFFDGITEKGGDSEI